MSIHNEATLGLLYAILAAFSFALWNIFLQRGLDRGGSSHLALLALGASVTGSFLPVTLWLGWMGRLPPLGPRPLTYFGLAGVMTAAVAPFHAAHATGRIGAAQTTSLRLLDPFFAFAIGLIFLGERVSVRAAGGVLLIVIALGFLQRDRRSNGATVSSRDRLTGTLFALGASLFFTVGSIMRKAGLSLMPSALVSSAIEGMVGLLIILTTVLIGRRWDLFRDAFNPQYQDLWLSGLSAAAGTIFLNLALQLLPVPVAVALRNTSPWFALLLVPLILGRQYRPGRWMWLSTLLLTGGMLFILMR